jgi:hypothetical protein
MTRLEHYRMITETATERGARWTNHDVATFHYFNPNGLAARKRALDTAIAAAVEDGLTSSGALLAYGSFNDGAVVALYEYMSEKRGDTLELRTILDDLLGAIDAAERHLANVTEAA